MKQTIPANIARKQELPGNKDFSFKNIAMGGPSMTALVHVPDLKIHFVNIQFERYLGYSSKDIAQGSVYFSDLLDQYQLYRLFYQLAGTIESIDAQSKFVIYRLKDKKGVPSLYYLYAAPATDNDGNVAPGDIYQFTLHPNLSKWGLPFSTFNTREIFFEHFNTEDFGTIEWIIDIDRVFWSAGISNILEIDDTMHEMSRAYAQSFIHAADKQRVQQDAKNALAAGNDLEIEFKVITAKNNTKTVHCIARVIKNKYGKPVKLAASIRDVTEQRRIEEDLKRKVTELYHSNQELEEFAYIASHDMQEPLRKITVFSDRLSEKYKDALTGEGTMYLSRMVAAAENMRLLIDGLLEFSRITKTKQPFEPVNLNTILQQTRTELELVIEDTSTTIHAEALPIIDAVASQMKQLFVNIIGNAIKFRKPGIAPMITITSKVITEDTHPNIELLKNATYYQISISDNGVGFEDEYAIRIFQVFQRLHGKTEYPGSGIGLAICKKILEYHSGIIYAENIPETGARFTIIIPQQQISKENK